MRHEDIETLNQISKYWHKDGHLNLDQRDIFIDVLKTLRPRYCFEIGFASGRSTVTTLIAAQPEILISVDISLDYIPGARAHAALLQQDFRNLKIIEGDSKQILNESFFKSNFPNGLDFAFVDGDHSYAGCISDLNTVLPYINPNGIILVDDYRSGPPNGVTFDSVTGAVDTFILKNQLKLEYWNKDGKGIAIIKRTNSIVRWLKQLPVILSRILFQKAKTIAAASKRRIGNTLRSKVNVPIFVVSILRSESQRHHALTWIKSCKKRYLLNEPSPWLTFDAIKFLKRYLKSGMKVFEYGSGGSTLFWQLWDAECISVEHDPYWFGILHQRVKSSASIDHRLITPELNHEAESSGNPADPDDYVSNGTEFQDYQFHNYVSQIDPSPDEYFDLVLVDGRARPSCIKHSVCKVKIGGVLIVDNSDRSYYFAQTKAYLEAFEKKEFWGVGPVNNYMWKTDIYIRVR